MTPDIEVFAAEAEKLYEQARDVDRGTAVYHMTKALLFWYGKGGERALHQVDDLIKEKFPRPVGAES